MLISLLTPAELVELELTEEPALAETAGLEMIALSIPDRGVPESVDSTRSTLTRLHAALEEGKVVAVHCRMGIGRASLIAASPLVVAGHSVDEAWRRVERARECAIPDTDEQRAWVRYLIRPLLGDS